MAHDVDVSLLTDDERALYAHLADATRHTGRWRAGVVLGVCLLTGLALLGVALATSRAEDETLLENVAGLAGLAVAGYGVVKAIGLARAAQTRRRQLERDASDYLHRIRYHERAREAQRRTAPRSGTSHDQAPMSRRQTQRAWYGEHRELGWRDREIGEALGIDADTYVNNVLEHDKD